MSVRLLIAGAMVVMLMPWVLVALLFDMTRQRATILGTIAAVAALLASGARSTTGGHVLDWLGIAPHMTIVVITFVFLLVASVAASARLDLARRRRLTWRSLPSQQEFGKFAIRRLQDLGWARQTVYSGALLTICRMEKPPRRITAIFLATAIDPCRLDAMLTSLTWKPYGRQVIVTWKQQIPAYVRVAGDTGRNVVSSDELERMDDAYDRLPEWTRCTPNRQPDADPLVPADMQTLFRAG